MTNKEKALKSLSKLQDVKKNIRTLLPMGSRQRKRIREKEVYAVMSIFEDYNIKANIMMGKGKVLISEQWSSFTYPYGGSEIQSVVRRCPIRAAIEFIDKYRSTLNNE